MSFNKSVRQQSISREHRTTPVRSQVSQGPKPLQTRAQASSRALELIVLALTGKKKSRVGGVTFRRSLAYEDFRTLFEGGRLILGNSELSGMHPNDVAVMFVDELAGRGYLEETEYGTFRPSAKLMAKVS